MPSDSNPLVPLAGTQLLPPRPSHMTGRSAWRSLPRLCSLSDQHGGDALEQKQSRGPQQLLEWTSYCLRNRPQAAEGELDRGHYSAELRLIDRALHRAERASHIRPFTYAGPRLQDDLCFELARHAFTAAPVHDT